MFEHSIQKRDNMVITEYTLLRNFLSEAGVEALSEVASGSTTGKNKLENLLSSLGKTRGEIRNSLTEGSFKEALVKLSEAKGIKEGRLRRTLIPSIIEFVNKNKKKVLTLVDVISELKDNPSDELVSQLQTLIVTDDGKRETIRQEMKEAGVSRTELIRAILQTKIGTEEPTDETFDESPQVKWLQYSATYTVGKGERKKTVRGAESRDKGRRDTNKKTGYVPIQDSKTQIENAVTLDAGSEFDVITDDLYFKISHPSMYKLIAGAKKDFVFEIEKEYSVGAVTDLDMEEVLSYYVYVARLPKSNLLYPVVNGNSTANTMIVKGKTINPYFIEFLNSGDIEPLNDLVDIVAKTQYLSGGAASELSERKISDVNIKDMYYGKLFNFLKKMYLGEISESDNKDMSDEEIEALKEALDEFKDIKQEEYEIFSQDDPDHVFPDRDSEYIGDNDIVSFEKDSESADIMRDALKNTLVSQYLRRSSMKTPAISLPDGDLDSRLKTDAEKLMYQMALEGKVGYAESFSTWGTDKSIRVDSEGKKRGGPKEIATTYSAKKDTTMALQSYVNFVYIFGDGLDEPLQKLESAISDRDSDDNGDSSDVASATTDLVTEFKKQIEKVKTNFTKGLHDKLSDIVTRKEHYQNEVDGILAKLVERNFIVDVDE